jgi:hypothetical protein
MKHIGALLSCIILFVLILLVTVKDTEWSSGLTTTCTSCSHQLIYRRVVEQHAIWEKDYCPKCGTKLKYTECAVKRSNWKKVIKVQ